jgi:hypothetical protein
MKKFVQHFFYSLADVSEGLLFPEGPKPFAAAPVEPQMNTNITSAPRPEADYGDEDPASSVEADGKTIKGKFRRARALGVDPETLLDDNDKEWLRLHA